MDRSPMNIVNIGVVVAVAAALIYFHNSKEDKTRMSEQSTSKGPNTLKATSSPQPQPEGQNNPQVKMRTAKGDIVIELYEDKCPNTVANFIYLVEKGHYKGSNFHRVGPYSPGTTGLKIAQGGRNNGREDFDWTIKNECIEKSYTGLKNLRGTIAMARQNPLHTAGCQFFINLQDMPQWDAGNYCVFGHVVDGLQAVEAIRPNDGIIDASVVRKRGHAYVPVVQRTGARDYAPAE